ncbi:hypothetical protein ACOI1C_08990 [Bacillus sp. DJP31]|uniref:hypothetical protein n=1 Tax=Bacillus sp. DJP31 TaxID=3409789 RepID=UPI003BB749A2
MKKIKVLAFLIAFCLFLIGISLYHNLQLEKSLPSNGWSRSITFPESVGMSPSFTYQDGNEYHIYNHDKEKIIHFIVDDKLEIKNIIKIPIQLPALAPFWAKGEQIIFYRNSEIIYFDGEKEKLLFKDVEGMAANEKNIVYWDNDELFSIDLKTLKNTSLGKSNYKIDNVILNNETSSFLVTSDRASINLRVTIFQKINGSYQPTEVATISEAGVEEVTGFSFIEKNDELSIMYTTFSTAQHKLNYRAYFTKVSMVNDVVKANFEEMLFYDEKSNERLRKPRFVVMFLKENKPTILFSSEGFTIGKRRAINIYESVQKDEKWIANRRDTGAGVSVQPVYLHDGAILWLDYSAKIYTLKGASTNPETIEKSRMVTSDDWINSLSYSLSGIFTGLLLLFIGLLWIIVPAIFLLIVSFINSELIEKGTKWVEWTSIGLYVGTQLLFSQRVFNQSVYSFAPDYLTFPGSFIIIPLILALIAYYFTRMSYNEEWGMLRKIFNFIGLDILFLLLLVGPYTL